MFIYSLCFLPTSLAGITAEPTGMAYLLANIRKNLRFLNPTMGKSHIFPLFLERSGLPTKPQTSRGPTLLQIRNYDTSSPVFSTPQDCYSSNALQNFASTASDTTASGNTLENTTNRSPGRHTAVAPRIAIPPASTFTAPSTP